jgi:hypothetical protein
MHLDKDAFASGQILSKLWLADSLERVIEVNGFDRELKILNLGGWYGILHFILKSRNKIKIKSWRSVDIDPDACAVADSINETWVWQNWKFKSITDDANMFRYREEEYDVVINTSVEHIESNQWFDNIPKNKLVILQSNDMPHDDHVHNHKTLEEFLDSFDFKEILFHGQKLFQYDDESFRRFMIIGIR